MKVSDEEARWNKSQKDQQFTIVTDDFENGVWRIIYLDGFKRTGKIYHEVKLNFILTNLKFS
ncbi:hypothetical protein C900_00432 [Fulvivirga imtechensis AK7]|uniref:Uncharacterized protein n=1 Tax=Fulvivirga imtechensis AK7 TaxID=1237149 RepID=L8JHV5_9BACT|nr:hypothetical protein C900_00432 [Fulvivirga imtechensis AK7]